MKAQSVTVREFLDSFAKASGIAVKLDEVSAFKAKLSTVNQTFGWRDLRVGLDLVLDKIPYTITYGPGGAPTEIVLTTAVPRLKGVAVLAPVGAAPGPGPQASPPPPTVPPTPPTPPAVASAAPPAPVAAPPARVPAATAPEGRGDGELKPELAAARERLQLSKQGGAEGPYAPTGRRAGAPVPPMPGDGVPANPLLAAPGSSGPAFLQSNVPQASSQLPGDPDLVLAKTKTGKPFLTIGEYNGLLKAMSARGKAGQGTTDQLIEQAITLKVTAELAIQNGYLKTPAIAARVKSANPAERTIVLTEAILQDEAFDISRISDKEAQAQFKRRSKEFSDIAGAPGPVQKLVVKQRLSLERWTDKVETFRKTLGITRGQ
ncbi:MAG: hypothetical protein HY815_03370 [Candidatus Riflebacteria bacterium]|nr:hypothetical protein [Candidatus Riflebacteria bacterium]